VQLRSLALLAVAVVACSGGTGAGDAPPLGLSVSIPDPIVLRVPRSGGTLQAYQYPALDSVVWTASQPVPSLARILAFDQEGGLLAFTTRGGQAGWLDLRLGRVDVVPRSPVTLAASADAWSVFVAVRDTAWWRLTPSGEWSLPVRTKAVFLFPLRDGGLVAIAEDSAGFAVRRLRPPDFKTSDSLALEKPSSTALSPLHDRLYIASGDELLVLALNEFAAVERHRLPGPVSALSTTPSGDRIFVAIEASSRLQVLDRYAGRFATPVELPAPVSELRMDPLGRTLLARADSGDLAFVIAIATHEVTAVVTTQWRADLPAVAPDGAVATLRDRDVLFSIPGSKEPGRVVRGGASDFWHFILWNGFRPRAKGLDQPVVFQPDSVAPGIVRDPAAVGAPIQEARPADSIRAQVAPQPDSARTRNVWTVSFAALLSEERARDLAQQIRVDGQVARVVVSTTDGVRIYRVVLGPYADKAEAERVGRASRRSYWVFEGVP
jgi:cell division septation protein DedD